LRRAIRGDALLFLIVIPAQAGIHAWKFPAFAGMTSP
jgi:hypothetical protein